MAVIELTRKPIEALRIEHLSGEDETPWVGVVEIPPSDMYDLATGWRHDVYVLEGSITLDTHHLETNDFLMHAESGCLSSDLRGARLLVYRAPSGGPFATRINHSKTRAWRQGRHRQMRVAEISDLGHSVSLVAWLPGATTRKHTHPAGEEIFVLRGELRDGENRYPAGTWLRLHPGTFHQPFADMPTMILLRHGHL